MVGKRFDHYSLFFSNSTLDFHHVKIKAFSSFSTTTCFPQCLCEEPVIHIQTDIRKNRHIIYRHSKTRQYREGFLRVERFLQLLHKTWAKAFLDSIPPSAYLSYSLTTYSSTPRKLSFVVVGVCRRVPVIKVSMNAQSSISAFQSSRQDPQGSGLTYLKVRWQGASLHNLPTISVFSAPP